MDIDEFADEVHRFPRPGWPGHGIRMTEIISIRKAKRVMGINRGLRRSSLLHTSYGHVYSTYDKWLIGEESLPDNEFEHVH